MENAEFVGLENFAPNQLKSAVYAFCSTGSNPDRPDVNPYIETLDLRGFQQNNLENMR